MEKFEAPIQESLLQELIENRLRSVQRFLAKLDPMLDD